MDDLSVFTGNANRPLAASICKHLRIPLGDADVFQFSNENIFVKINDNVRGRDVFIIQPFCTPVNRSSTSPRPDNCTTITPPVRISSARVLKARMRQVRAEKCGNRAAYSL